MKKTAQHHFINIAKINYFSKKYTPMAIKTFMVKQLNHTFEVSKYTPQGSDIVQAEIQGSTSDLINGAYEHEISVNITRFSKTDKTVYLRTKTTVYLWISC